jgi:hypothetical protein
MRGQVMTPRTTAPQQQRRIGGSVAAHHDAAAWFDLLRSSISMKISSAVIETPKLPRIKMQLLPGRRLDAGPDAEGKC